MISDYAKRQGQDYQKLRENCRLLSSKIPRRLRRGSFIYADSAVSAVSLEQALACKTGCPLLARSL